MTIRPAASLPPLPLLAAWTLALYGQLPGPANRPPQSPPGPEPRGAGAPQAGAASAPGAAPAAPAGDRSAEPPGLPGPTLSLRLAEQRLSAAIGSAEPWWARWLGRPGLAAATGLSAGRSVANFESDVRQVERALSALPPSFLPPRQRLEHATTLAAATRWRCWCALRPWSRDPRYWLERLESALLELPAAPNGAGLIAWLKRAKQVPELVAEARAALREAPAAMLPSGQARAARLRERARRLPAEVLSTEQPADLRATLREVLAAADQALGAFERHLAEDCVPSDLDRTLGAERFAAWLGAATGSDRGLDSIELRLERELLAVQRRLAALPEPGPPAAPDPQRASRLLEALPGALAPLGLDGWPAPTLLGAESVAGEPGAPGLRLRPRGYGLLAELSKPDASWSEARRLRRLQELGPAGISAALLLAAWPGGLCLEAQAARTPIRQLRGWPDPVGSRGAAWLLVGWARELGLFQPGSALGPEVDAALERLWQRELCLLWAGLRLHARQQDREALVDGVVILAGFEPTEARELLLAVELDPTLGMSAWVGLDWLDLWAERRQAAELPAEVRASWAALLAADPRLRAPLLEQIQAPPRGADTDPRSAPTPPGGKNFAPDGATGAPGAPASRPGGG